MYIHVYLGVQGLHLCSASLFCLFWICGFLTSTVKKSKEKSTLILSKLIHLVLHRPLTVYYQFIRLSETLLKNKRIQLNCIKKAFLHVGLILFRTYIV